MRRISAWTRPARAVAELGWPAVASIKVNGVVVDGLRHLSAAELHLLRDVVDESLDALALLPVGKLDRMTNVRDPYRLPLRWTQLAIRDLWPFQGRAEEAHEHIERRRAETMRRLFGPDSALVRDLRENLARPGTLIAFKED